MATSLNFKDIIHLPEWRPLANCPSNGVLAGTMSYDPRGTEDRHPEIFYFASNALLYKYNVKTDEWFVLLTPGVTGTFGAGATSIFHPTAGPRGTLAAGWSTTQGALTTALPASVGPNQLANRGDGRGFRIRIIGSSAGGSGKIEERLIIANSGPSTTPTLVLDSPLSFTPALGDTYEILSGRVFLLGALTQAAGQWKYYDIATNSYSGNLSVTNLPASITIDSVLVALSEAHNPYTKVCGEGFVTGASTYNAASALSCLLATAATGTTLTGQAAAGDASLLANEYRNFQIRIVEDTATPTAVGQRRRIVSHTAGASPVYTVAAWTVTPSATCKFVIENDDDKILLWSSGVTTTFNYNIGANTWDTSTWAVRPAAIAAGVKAEQAYGIVQDANKYARNSFIYSFRGGAVATLDLFDIAAAATGSWTGGITYGGSSGVTIGSGSSAAYDPNTLQGKYLYLNQTGTQRFLRLDLLNRVIEAFAFLRYAQSTVTIGEKCAITTFVDGNTRLAFLMTLRHTGPEFFQVALQR